MIDFFHNYSIELKALLNIIIAMALGGVIGWNRERARKPAGIRTMMIVSGSAAFLIALGPFLVLDMDKGIEQGIISSDPTRLVQAIITGVSFIGAGTIIRSRKGMDVEGITTAASLLFAAAIGIACATEKYVMATGATVLGLLVLLLFNVFEKKLDIKKTSEDGDDEGEEGDEDKDEDKESGPKTLI